MDSVTVQSYKGAQLRSAVSPSAVEITYLQDAAQDFVECRVTPDFRITGDEYVLFPACCYDGNRFDSLPRKYPPLFTSEEARLNMPVTITDVPRLHKDGSGCIEVTTGDLSVPCVGIFSAISRQAFFLFTIQELGGVNLGLSYERGTIGITYPHMRKSRIYRWPFLLDASDSGRDFREGETVSIPYHIIHSPCDSLGEFYRLFFENRHCLELDSVRCKPMPFAEQAAVQLRKFNTMNWIENPGFYTVGTEHDIPYQVWQPGWVGGAMSSYALMILGGETEWQRGVSTLRHLFRTQMPSGFFLDACDREGSPVKLVFDQPYSENWHLIRKSADVLYFLFKHFRLFRERGLAVPEDILTGTRRLADAFVALWDTYRQFGQFVHLETGEIVVGGSSSGAIVPAGLVEAFRFFGDRRYLEVAEASAESLFAREAERGYTTGGPEEILQCPDSESAFGLLESLALLYEETRAPLWLDRAVCTANLCSSWVVAYNYRFPVGSEFAELGMKTTGAVFANVQNKHAAPGICTLSGDSLYKLYRWTGDRRYLELFLDIALSVSQYMSTKTRPVHSWDMPKDAVLLEADPARAERETLPEGFINERVNMSDWESDRCVGGVFNGSCWPETSNLLILAECAGFPEVAAAMA